VKIEQATVSKEDAVEVELRTGGGFIARFTRS
jgi:hypothetical protein